jgi:hypothetical protein
MRFFAKSVRLLHLIAMLLIGVAGCGLADYQSRMDAQRERVKEFDDANRSLDEPIEIPLLPSEKLKEPKDDVKEQRTEEANPAWLFDFYLRLPKGFGKTPKDKVPYFSPFPCFRYSGIEPGYDILIAAALVADPKTKEPEMFGKYTPDNFRSFLRVAIKDFYAKTNNKLDLKLPDKEIYQVIDVKMLSPFSDVTSRIAYQYIVYSDSGNPKIKEPSQFRVYLHEEPPNVKGGIREPGKQIAIVVHRPMRTSDDPFDKAIAACLGTLDANEATSKRQQYKKAMKR